MALYGSTIPTDHGEFVVTIICPNRGSWEALKIAADQITPAAYEPGIPERTAKLMQRDGIVPEAAEVIPPANIQPPNCDGMGNTAAPPSLAEQAAAQMREYDATKDDDEGDLVGENYGGTE